VDQAKWGVLMTLLHREWHRIRNSGLARNAGWMLVGQGLSVSLQGFYFVLLAHLLGPVEYGIFAGAFALSNLVAAYSSLGTGVLFLRYVGIDRTAFSIYWANILAVTVLLGGAVTLALHFVGRVFLNPQSADLVALAGVANCICAQLMLQAGRVFQAIERMRVTATLNVLSNLFRTIAVVVMILILHHAGAWDWAVASTVVSALAALLAIGCVTACLGWPHFSVRLLLRRAPEGFGYSFAGSTTSIYNDLDKTMLSHYGMNEANGIYTMAYRILDVATIPISAVQEAALPRLFIRGQRGLTPVAELATGLLRRTLPLSAVVACGLFLFSPVVPVLLGPGFAQASMALRWLCFILVFRSIHQLAGGALTGAGMQTYRTAAQLVAAGLNFLLNVWLIPHYTWRGAAWASLATDGALAAMNCGLVVIRTRATPFSQNAA
jgi:O-antigen/teichoic acid export membrane protein